MSECGCRIVYEPAMSKPIIKYCPLHAAAERMLQALIKAQRWLSEAGAAFENAELPATAGDFYKAARSLDAAIAAAKGEADER